MTSEKQLEANRLNAQLSPGPLTHAGKASSSQNALKSGLYSRKMIIRGEKLEDLLELEYEYYACYCPVTPIERDQVDILVSSTWQYRRLCRIDAEMYGNTISGFTRFDPETIIGKVFCLTDQQHARLERMQKGLQKSIRDAVHELERLRKVRLAAAQAAESKPAKPTNGFVSSSSPKAPSTAPETPAAAPIAPAATPVATEKSAPAAPQNPQKAA